MVWKYASNAAPECSLKEHFHAICSTFRLENLKKDALPMDLEVYLDVGVMHDTLTCRVDLDASLLRTLAEAGIGIEISTYPTDFTLDNEQG